MPKDVYEEYLEKHTLDEILREQKADGTPNTKEKIMPSPVEPLSLERRLYGLLISESVPGVGALKYIDLNAPATYTITGITSPLVHILTTNDEVCYTTYSYSDGGQIMGRGVGTLLSECSYCRDRGDIIAIVRWKGKIVAARQQEIIDVLTNQKLIAPKMDTFTSILSLYSDTTRLFVLILRYTSFMGFVPGHVPELKEIHAESGSFSLGETIYRYKTFRSINSQQCLLVPYPFIDKKGKSSPLSMVYAHHHFGNCLYLNGKVIDGSVQEGENMIAPCSQLEQQEKIAHIICSISKSNQIINCKIDLQESKVVEKELLATSEYHLSALAPITNSQLHQKLIAKGRINA